MISIYWHAFSKGGSFNTCNSSKNHVRLWTVKSGFDYRRLHWPSSNSIDSPTLCKFCRKKSRRLLIFKYIQILGFMSISKKYLFSNFGPLKRSKKSSILKLFKKSNERDSNSHLTPKLYTVNRPTNILAEPKGYNFVRSPRTFGWNQVWRQIDDFTYKNNKIVRFILVQNLFEASCTFGSAGMLKLRLNRQGVSHVSAGTTLDKIM